MTTLTTHRPSRRSFLKAGAAAAVAPLIIPKRAFGANERVRLAWVGFNNMGWGDLRSCGSEVDVVALCDCNDTVMESKAGMYPAARQYRDFRKMLDEMDDQIDAVGIATPDHVHFPVAYACISRGKHVFVEKPLAHSVWEVQTLQALAKAKGVITQMGNQGHGSEGIRLIKEWYEAGLIGEVREVLTWTDRPKRGWGFPGHPGGGHKNYFDAQPVPEHLDWDLWLGPTTKEIPFHHTYALDRQGAWRPWWDFGCGGLGDIGCHTIDSPFWALELGAPEAVEVEMKHPANLIYTPNGSVVTYSFPARGKQPPVKVKWYEGPSMPKPPACYDWGESFPGHGGMLMVGEKGGIFHGGMRPDSPRLSRKADWEDYRRSADKRVPKTLPRVPGIHKEWVRNIKTGKPCCSDFSYSAPLTETIILGTLAIRTGQGFTYDTNRGIQGNDAARDLVKVPARKGWGIKDLG